MTVFFLAGLYVSGALVSLALLLMEVFSDAPLANIISNRVWETYTWFLLVAIPLFILMGELVQRSGIADRMYRALDRRVAPIPAWLLHTNMVSCSIFAACSGSSISTAATISRVALTAFLTRGYNERLVAGSLAAGGARGILIPPNVLFLISGLSTGTSVGRLFLAGFHSGRHHGPCIHGLHRLRRRTVAPGRSQSRGRDFSEPARMGRTDRGIHRSGSGGNPGTRGDGFHLRRNRHSQLGCGNRSSRLLCPALSVQLQATPAAGAGKSAEGNRADQGVRGCAPRVWFGNRTGGASPVDADVLPGVFPATVHLCCPTGRRGRFPPGGPDPPPCGMGVHPFRGT